MMRSRPRQQSFCLIAASLFLQIVWILPSMVAVFAMAGTSLAAEETADAEGPEVKEAARARQMESMTARAERAVVRRLEAGKGKVEPLNPQSLFRYSDEPRGILDGSIWSWPAQGRPVVLQKVELYDVPKGRPKWFFCVASLSEDLVEMTSAGGIAWVSAKPGVEMRPLPDAPEAVESAIGRSVQMKSIARRFAVTESDPPVKIVQQMRLLSRPLHRYSDPGSGILDGAIFGFATNGTNPNFLLLIELTGADVSHGTWRYGLARMTLLQLNVRLDEAGVWSVPYVAPRGPGRPSRFDTWAYSWEPKE